MTEATAPVEVRAGPVEEFPAGTVRLVVASGRRVAVGNAGGELFALDDTCLHRGGSLACGHLAGAVLACPMHWWRYDVRTGERLGQPGLRLRRYPIRVVDGEVRVTVPPAPPVRSWREILLDHARRGSGGLKSEAETQAVSGHAKPSGSPPVNQGSGGLKSEAGTQAVGGHAKPSGSPPVNQAQPVRPGGAE